MYLHILCRLLQTISLFAGAHIRVRVSGSPLRAELAMSLAPDACGYVCDTNHHVFGPFTRRHCFRECSTQKLYGD